jgi:hypothetical protein
MFFLKPTVETNSEALMARQKAQLQKNEPKRLKSLRRAQNRTL